MERREESNQNNQPNVTAAIENLQASVAKLQTLLTSPQVQADLHPKLEILREQSLASLQAKFASGKIATLSSLFMEPVARQIMTEALNNQHASAMQQEAIKSLNLSKTESCLKVNSTVALDRSRDIQDRLYYHETAEQTARWLTEEMSKMSAREAAGGANSRSQTTSKDAAIQSSIYRIDGEKYGTP